MGSPYLGIDTLQGILQFGRIPADLYGQTLYSVCQDASPHENKRNKKAPTVVDAYFHGSLLRSGSKIKF